VRAASRPALAELATRAPRRHGPVGLAPPFEADLSIAGPARDPRPLALRSEATAPTVTGRLRRADRGVADLSTVETARPLLCVGPWRDPLLFHIDPRCPWSGPSTRGPDLNATFGGRREPARRWSFGSTSCSTPPPSLRRGGLDPSSAASSAYGTTSNVVPIGHSTCCGAASASWASASS
jgi:hypothetical protein